MTTLVPFQPSTGAPFSFQPTLDGAIYTVFITWNLFGRRFYFNLYTLDGVLVISQPLIGSPPAYDVNLLPPSFVSTLLYRTASQTLEITP